MKDRDYTRSGLRIVLTALASVIAAVVLFGLSETPAQMSVLPPSPGITSEPVDGVVEIGTPINFTAVFTDPPPFPDETQEWRATWSWGDGSESICDYLDECIPDYDGTYGTLMGSHIYNDPGVYKVAATVTGSFVEPDTSTFKTFKFEIDYDEFVIAYDPTGGFVTGGGWIDSLAGAYKPDVDMTGKATFGFVSKYKKGASVPQGNTEFVFQAADLNFHSASYEWLVVNGGGARAQFKGVGTINGAGDYKFMLWAGDGEPDTFRIKIWYEDADGEHVVYDNGYEGSGYETGQPIGGGSIVIHTKK
jgi:hypothetical protein